MIDNAFTDKPLPAEVRVFAGQANEQARAMLAAHFKTVYRLRDQPVDLVAAIESLADAVSFLLAFEHERAGGDATKLWLSVLAPANTSTRKHG